MNIIEDIRDALLHAFENRSPPPFTPMDLRTVLKNEWCELPPRYLQPLVESMPHRVAALLCVLGALHDIRQVYQFFLLFSVFDCTRGLLDTIVVFFIYHHVTRTENEADFYCTNL
ncbi:hypothetical protein AVEN_63832-1 [Araneus ventricosus]|uniref:Uncharacterized protein n=1 Tax=Araneus ventricosus TaxID=182803 RepID=A0A4Y2FVP5_ARAVE|nr:hypothetical protein AVEN_63832-1 [Araneus ventricosus]